MYDTIEQLQTSHHLSHDRLCVHCGHAMHTYLACSDACDCRTTAQGLLAG
ncbi:hypothetical protein [Nocardioides sp. R-C-SC26]|nr:hypothetical protein [Nocardioides sp. R-C-SC26]